MSKTELELMDEFEREEIDLPDLILMCHLLIKRGWIWKMPLDYQVMARGWIAVGILDDMESEVTMSNPLIKIVVDDDGRVIEIISERGFVDVEVQEKDGHTKSSYTISPNRDRSVEAAS